MLINDIEYAFRFWVDDEEDNTICDEVFSSFEEMNEFLKNAFHDEKYNGLTAVFSPVEVVDGKPDDAVKLFYDIFPIMELLPEEIEDFLYDIKKDFRFQEDLAPKFNKDTQFIPCDDAVDFESKKMHREEITYICPFCFHELDDCRCSCYSYYLVQIDKLIVPIIRTLNKKGYITTACCSGHIEKNDCTTIYVAFKEDYFSKSNLPVGAVYLKSEKMLKYDDLRNMTAEERKEFQAECLERLAIWAENLQQHL